MFDWLQILALAILDDLFIFGQEWHLLLQPRIIGLHFKRSELFGVKFLERRPVYTMVPKEHAHATTIAFGQFSLSPGCTSCVWLALDSFLDAGKAAFLRGTFAALLRSMAVRATYLSSLPAGLLLFGTLHFGFSLFRSSSRGAGLNRIRKDVNDIDLRTGQGTDGSEVASFGNRNGR